MKTTVEYRVRPVTRYVVTEHHSQEDGNCCGGGVETIGEFENEEFAERVAGSMARDAGFRWHVKGGGHITVIDSYGTVANYRNGVEVADGQTQ